MARERRRVKLAAVAAATLLYACAGPYWQANPQWDGFKPAEIQLVEKDDPGPDCGAASYSVLGCAVRSRSDNRCTVFVQSRLPYREFACVVTHETRHCVGDDHLAANGRPTFAVDCGTGELYSGPVSRPG